MAYVNAMTPSSVFDRVMAVCSFDLMLTIEIESSVAMNPLLSDIQYKGFEHGIEFVNFGVPFSNKYNSKFVPTQSARTSLKVAIPLIFPVHCIGIGC